jgi:hypothetical protein
MNSSGLGTFGSATFGAAGPYAPLQKYLAARYANVVVLTFQEIGDLLGFPLPAIARVERDWWGPPAPGSALSTQSQSWTLARRTATPNLMAQTVLFERTSA